jgi:hypothetical protein
MWLLKKHRTAALTLGIDALCEDLLHQRIQPSSRLVENEQLRVAGQRRNQRHFLPIAPGVGGPLLGWIKLKALQHLVPASPVDAAAQPAEQVDHFTSGELRPQVDLARDIRQPAVQGGGIGPWVAVKQPNSPRRRPQ